MSQTIQQVKLSILIITIPDRAEKLKKLKDILLPQLPTDGSVELVIKEELPANQGGPTIGQNRNAALEDASGDYVCFVDDDDRVSDDYVDKILKAIETNPDVVGIKGHYILGKNKPELFIHSIEYKEWFSKDNVHYRCPNHLNPVKRELALQVKFNEKNFGEDQDYSLAIRPLLKTEVMIDKVIYFYLK